VWWFTDYAGANRTANSARKCANRLCGFSRKTSTKGFGADLGQRVVGQEARAPSWLRGVAAIHDRRWAGGAGRKWNVEAVHQWREREALPGELVQWDTFDHDWLEGRGERFYLILMIDDATNSLTARFVEHDSTEQNMRLLLSYLQQHGQGVRHRQSQLVPNCSQSGSRSQALGAPGAATTAADPD
jgi:hypothetical protein